MLNKMKSDYLSFILIVGFFIFVLEILFFNSGLVFSLLFSSLLIYFGRKKWHWLIGKVAFVIGLLSVSITVFHMMTFNFLLLATLAYFVIKYARSRQNPAHVQPEIAAPREEPILKQSQKWFQNKLYGHQKTPDNSYTWDDVNIQCGVGDTVIDLSNTVLPKGEAVIFIRNIIGNIEILIPYEVEMRVQHSVMIGSTNILEQAEPSIFNQTTHFQTSGYENSTQKVRIITSVLVGSLEVKRV